MPKVSRTNETKNLERTKKLHNNYKENMRIVVERIVGGEMKI